MASLPFLKTEFTIPQGMVIDGNISSDGAGVIAGVVNGDVSVSSKLVIEKTGQVNGKVKAKSLLVKGTIKGNVACEEKVIAQKNAVITGNIVAAEVIIDRESIINGAITQLNNNKPAEPVPAEKIQQRKKELYIEIPIIDTPVNTPADMKPDEPAENWF